MQYLSANGIPTQTAVQYIQLLRPIMMVPASPYQSAKPASTYQPAKPVAEYLTQTTTAPITPSPKQFSSYGPYSRPVVGSFSSHYPSYLQSNPRPLMSQQPSYDMGLNMNEYMPAASNRINSILAARSSMTSALSPYAYAHSKYQQLAQRA